LYIFCRQCAPWKVDIPEDVLFDLAVMATSFSGQATYSHMLEFIYDNFPYYRLAR
jgi:hypothetical protein